jgi:ABC transporter substrate binding protein (PQQ-dependent alcohol dehydrogenase system)
LLGAADNNTTGKFTNQTFVAIDALLAEDGDAAAAIDALAEQGVLLIIADLSAERLLAASERAKTRGALLFNVSATDDSLREENCRANVVHVAPARSMLADGLAQYLIWKQWRRWLLIKGSHPQDELLAHAYRQAAKKFGAKIVEERVYEDTGGGRRVDSGSVQTQRQMPVLTQNAAAHDVLIAADETQVFAGYLPYRNWDARPVAGSAGLSPTNWDPAHEQWGAHQLQNRFIQTYRRPMNARDNGAWLAMRMIGEATTRTGSNEPEKLRAFLTSPEFSIAAFKGVRLTLRPWNQQLRQPILLSDGRVVASVSPQEGFLHQVTELDTLGADKPETKCGLR